MSPLSEAEVDAFVRDGFVRVDHAFTRGQAAAAVASILAGTGVDVSAPLTWPGPVLRVVVGQPAILDPEGEWRGGFTSDDAHLRPVQQAVRAALDSP